MSHSAKSVENIDAQQSALFNMICDDLESKSYSVQQNALPAALIKLLCERVKSEDEPHYRSAGIGRSTAHHENKGTRRDEIAWIDDELPTDQSWNCTSSGKVVFLSL